MNGYSIARPAQVRHQGSLMAEQLGIKLLSTGDLFRGILEDEAHPLYPQVQVVRMADWYPMKWLTW